jgi:hypothetical protein
MEEEMKDKGLDALIKTNKPMQLVGVLLTGPTKKDLRSI